MKVIFIRDLKKGDIVFPFHVDAGNPQPPDILKNLIAKVTSISRKDENISYDSVILYFKPINTDPKKLRYYFESKQGSYEKRRILSVFSNDYPIEILEESDINLLNLGK